MTNYNNMILFGCGILGILLHNLIELNKINRKNSGNINIRQYLRLEKFSILISLLSVCVALVAKNEIAQLQNVGTNLWLAFITIGYTGQSLIVFMMNRTSRFFKNEK